MDAEDSTVQGIALRERGASLVEYALLLALIALVALSAVAFFGTSVSSNMSRSASVVQSAG